MINKLTLSLFSIFCYTLSFSQGMSVENSLQLNALASTFKIT